MARPVINLQPADFKRCFTCQCIRPATQFRKNKYGQHGLAGTCFKCEAFLAEHREPVECKKCSGCGVVKPADSFGPRRRSPDGLETRCRPCVASYATARRTPEQKRAEKARAAARAGRIYRPGKRGAPPDPLTPERQARRASEKEARAAWVEWMKRAPDDWHARYWATKGEPWRNPRISDAEQYRLRYRLDPEFNLSQRLKTQRRKAAKRLGVAELIRGAFRRDAESPKAERLLGYKMSELRVHLERQFTKGMTWGRFIAGEIHIDHIIPVASFDVTDDEEFKACWALTNLRPLWARDNIEKHAKRLHLI